MKSLKKISSVILCVMMAMGVSSCVTPNDSSSSSPEGELAAEKISKEEWIAAFDLLFSTGNVTRDWSYFQMDDDLNPTSSFKALTKIADGDKYYVYHYDRVEYTSDGLKNSPPQEEYVGKVDGVDYYYQKDQGSGAWGRMEYPLEFSYVLDSTGVDIWVNAYDEMTYNAETGVYRLENKVVDTDTTLPRTMYYMEVEFRDGKIYRIEHETDVVGYDMEGIDIVWKLDGRCKSIAYHYDYGTTEVTLPEILSS